MATNALAPYITRPSAVMVLTMLNKQIIVFHEKGFQLPHCWEMIENGNIFLAETKQLYKQSCPSLHLSICHTFLSLSPLGWRGIVVTVQAGGWPGGCQTFCSRKLCNVMVICPFAPYGLAHGPKTCQMGYHCGADFAEHMSLKTRMDLHHSKFYGIV